MLRSVVFVALALCAPACALAMPVGMISSGVEGSDGTPYPYVGDNYQTTGVDVSASGSNVTLSFTTLFSGNENVAGYTINYADVFLNNGLAISLGDETANGGLAQSGLYQVGSYLTSQQVWGGRPGVIYGQGYMMNGAVQASPTVLTGGTFLEGVSVADTLSSNGTYDLAITRAPARPCRNLLRSPYWPLVSSGSLLFGFAGPALRRGKWVSKHGGRCPPTPAGVRDPRPPFPEGSQTSGIWTSGMGVWGP